MYQDGEGTSEGLEEEAVLNWVNKISKLYRLTDCDYNVYWKKLNIEKVKKKKLIIS